MTLLKNAVDLFFLFVSFVSVLLNRVRLFRLIHFGASVSLVPSFKIPLTLASCRRKQNKRTLFLLFYLTAGRNVCTNKEGLKLTLSHQPNIYQSDLLACLAIQKPGTLLTSMAEQQTVRQCFPLDLQWLVIVAMLFYHNLEKLFANQTNINQRRKIQPSEILF